MLLKLTQQVYFDIRKQCKESALSSVFKATDNQPKVFVLRMRVGATVRSTKVETHNEIHKVLYNRSCLSQEK